MHGENNIIFCAYKDATDAQPWILYIFRREDEGKGRGRDMRGGGGGCALACVIIRAETIECTQNAE